MGPNRSFFFRVILVALATVALGACQRVVEECVSCRNPTGPSTPTPVFSFGLTAYELEPFDASVYADAQDLPRTGLYKLAARVTSSDGKAHTLTYQLFRKGQFVDGKVPYFLPGEADDVTQELDAVTLAPASVKDVNDNFTYTLDASKIPWCHVGTYELVAKVGDSEAKKIIFRRHGCGGGGPTPTPTPQPTCVPAPILSVSPDAAPKGTYFVLRASGLCVGATVLWTVEPFGVVATTTAADGTSTWTYNSSGDVPGTTRSGYVTSDGRSSKVVSWTIQ